MKTEDADYVTKLVEHKRKVECIEASFSLIQASNISVRFINAGIGQEDMARVLGKDIVELLQGTIHDIVKNKIGFELNKVRQQIEFFNA